MKTLRPDSCSFFILFLLLTALLAPPDSARADHGARSKNEMIEAEPPDAPSELEEEGPTLFVDALLYLPNRVFDLLDVVRCRARIGPGVAASARVTEVAQVFAGSYASVFAGMPGPRLRRRPKLPVGLESHNGASVSIADATVDGGIGPDYSPTEVGLGFHILLLGVDIGFDPVEIVDFVAGIFTVDLRDDDL